MGKDKTSRLKWGTAVLGVVLTAGIIGVGSAWAVDAPPSMPGGTSGPGGTPGGTSSGSVSYTGATELSSDTTLADVSYASTTGGQNALLVSGGTIDLSNVAIEKSGDESDENSDFYGTNAAVLVYNGGSLKLIGGTVTTNGGHANGVFAYGSGVITLDGTKITTTANNSGGVMVTGGGTLTANNLTVQTAGNSSAAIRSDRGGGTMLIVGGKYQTDGVGSPAIYSTADITVKDAELISTASEGVVIEGLNSVSLDGVTLTDTNNTLNGNSETYKNIFIYQSMSGDAAEGTGTFVAKNSTITTNQGDTFFITNTTAQIELSGNTFVNNDGAFLRAQSGKWGNSGTNGGQVTLTATDQDIWGDLVLDEISTLAWSLMGDSYYRGVINGTNTAGALSLKLEAEAVVVLEGDSYLSTLENADTGNSNIYANGHKLYVGGAEVEINQAEPPEREVTLVATSEYEDEVELPRGWWRFYLAGGVIALVILVIVLMMVKNRHRKVPKDTQPMVSAADAMTQEKKPEIDEIIVADAQPAQTTQVPPKPAVENKTDIDVNDITPDDVE